MAFSPPGRNTKIIKIPGDVTRCEVRGWKKCPLFTCPTRGTWMLSKSLKLIFKHLSPFCQRGCCLQGMAMKTWWKNRWELGNNIRHRMMKRNLMVFGEKPFLMIPYCQDTLICNYVLNNQWTVSQEGDRIIIMWLSQLCFRTNDCSIIFPASVLSHVCTSTAASASG